MRRLRTVIVDDEPLALRRVTIALKDRKDVEIVGVAADGLAALELVKAAAPDLILADIEMPGLTGLGLLEAIDLPSPPAVIFVTAHDRFAAEAFEGGAVDYVLKPVGEKRLGSAIERAAGWLRSRNAEERIAELRATIEILRRNAGREQPGRYENALWIGTRSGAVRVAVADVIWLEAAGDYVAVHTHQREHILHSSLTALEKRLDPDVFLRVHRGAIVRIGAVTALETANFGALQLRVVGGGAVSVSRSRKAAVKAALRKAAAGSVAMECSEATSR